MNKIPETMLITLWAKATENQQQNPLLRDEKAMISASLRKLNSRKQGYACAQV